MTTTPRTANPTRRRSRLTVTALALVSTAVGLAACNSEPATDTAQTTPPVVQKSAGVAESSNFQFYVANATDQTIPVRLCYAEINADSCFTVNVSKDKPTDAFIHARVTGVVGEIPKKVPTQSPIGVSFDMNAPGLGIQQFAAATAELAMEENLKGLDTYAVAFPAAPSDTKFYDLADDDNYHDFTINGYTLRINRKGDATNGNKVVWLTVLAAPLPTASTTSTTTTKAP